MIRFSDNRHGGFTLLETLLTVAILVILLGVSAVGVAYYRDYLKITELDNEAREIYMAAENRAVLLQNSGATIALLGEKKEAPADPVILSNREAADSANLSDLLPAGVIDPALREGHFLVLYDACTHHVTEVFYAEGDIGSDLKPFRHSRSQRVSYYRENTSGRRLVGWYSGGTADSIGTKPLPTPGVEVFIDNGEELTLTVTYTLPEGVTAKAGGTGVLVTPTPSVKLEYGGTPVDLLTSSRIPAITGEFSAANGNKVTYKWVLDSLESETDPVSRKRTFPKQFRGLVSGSLGKDFTVTAGLTLKAVEDGYIDSAYYAQGTDNSLFAKETHDGGTAYIANVRHLQNLHLSHSGAGSSITEAEQLCDVDCKGEGYNFIPIANGALTSYNGQQKAISGLYVSCPGDAGLFGLVTNDIIFKNIRLLSPRITSTGPAAAGGESNAAPLLARVDTGTCTLSDIEVIDGSASGKTYAGGLAGVVNQDASCNLENCRVYWNTPGELAKGSNIVYMVSGNCAGGLIGYASGKTDIRNSFAASTVEGEAQSGGLAGKANSLIVSGSYADCYLTGNGMTGGLVGQSQTTLDLTDCYAAGFIMEPGGSLKAAGLVNGTSVTARNCYSAVRVVLGDGSLESPATPLYGTAGNGSGNVLYLSTAAEAAANPFGPTFEYPNATSETHVYDLRHRLNGAVEKLTPPYPFPGLKTLPHYGDWAELDSVPAGLVYYEIYETYPHGPIGVSGVQEDGTSFQTLKETPPLRDGYALVFEGTVPGNYTIKYGNEGGSIQTWTLKNNGMWHTNGTNEHGVETFPLTVGGKSYTLVLLPDAIVTEDLPGGNFYQKLTCGTGADMKTYWFNPHFAKTVHTGETAPGPPTSSGNPVYVRTPRHLFDLSCFQDKYVNKWYSFGQELDLDYAAYSWYGSNQPNGGSGGTSYQQPPIGRTLSSSASFRGTYDGGCHKIKNVFFISTENEYQHLGLFGAVNGKKGVDALKNIVYELDPERVEAVACHDSVQSFGTLVGNLQQGDITNCAVYGVNICITKTGGELQTYGGLVGSSSLEKNTITGCSAELVSLKVENGWVGGLVGSSSGTVENSYAVGKIVVTGAGGASGLVNETKDGFVKNCYAAVSLTATDEIRGLSNKAPDDKIINSGFLTGAFQYRGEIYTVDEDYVGPGERIPPAKLAEKIKSLSQASATIHYNISGKSWRSDYEGDGKEAFPYLTGVKDAENKSVHYGLWPVEYEPPAGLAYYETYSDDTTGVSGQYENTKIMTLQTKTVVRDGYALVFEGGIPEVDYAVKYGNSGQQGWTLSKSESGEYVWKNGSKQQPVTSMETDGYTLIPLPDKIVTGELPDGDIIEAEFYQKLVYGEGLLHSRTFYFNPHFAGRLKGDKLVSVEAGSVKPNASYTAPKVPGKPVNPGTGSVPVWAATYGDVEKVWKENAIAVRTARHFYALSRFQNTYVVENDPKNPTKRYYFEQCLDLDYNSYGWYGEQMPAQNASGYYMQVPIGQGTRDDGFKGAYNGGGHTIRNVFYTTQGSNYVISPKSQYIGLFRYVEYIANVNYVAPGGIEVAVQNDVDKRDDNGKPSGSDLLCGAKVGTLIGGCFRASHCTATLQDFTVKCGKGKVYIGGLAGYSNKINSCRVMINGCLSFEPDGGTVNTVCVGGLQGLVYQEIVNCTSKVKSLVVKNGQNIYAGGLVGGIAYDSPDTTTRVVAGCATEIKDLHVGQYAGVTYAGGLIGRNSDGGRIYASYAVGAIGFMDPYSTTTDQNPNHHYSGLVGLNENKSNHKITIKNCYSAVGLPGGSGTRNHNFCFNKPSGGTIENCYYLTGTWRYGGIRYTVLSDTAISGVTGKAYDELKTTTLPSGRYSHSYALWGTDRTTIYNIPEMTAGGTGYPFPINTGNINVFYGIGNFTQLSGYEVAFLPYPGDDWPFIQS